MRKILIFSISLFLGGCLGLPEGVRPVGDFALHRYLGTWYEIARLDHRFERGLQKITAEYSRREDGGVRVVNRGYDPARGEWRQAEGKAYFVGDPAVGHLRVSFFGPFYGSYVVFGLDREDYRIAYVTGPNKDYLWLLARTPRVDEATLARFTAEAARLGYDTDGLIFVEHD